MLECTCKKGDIGEWHDKMTVAPALKDNSSDQGCMSIDLNMRSSDDNRLCACESKDISTVSKHYCYMTITAEARHRFCDVSDLLRSTEPRLKLARFLVCHSVDIHMELDMVALFHRSSSHLVYQDVSSRQSEGSKGV